MRKLWEKQKSSAGIRIWLAGLAAGLSMTAWGSSAVFAGEADSGTADEEMSSQLLCSASGETALQIYSSSESVAAAVTSTDSYILGDVDGSGAVNVLDVTVLKRYTANMSVTINASASDINADADINAIDVTLLARYIAQVGTNTWGIGEEVTVLTDVESLALDISESNLALGGTLQLTATISPEDAADTSEIIWSSSDPSVATVSAEGLVTASAENYGMAVITAQIGSCEAQCTVYVGNMVVFYGVQDGMELTVSDYEEECEVYTYAEDTDTYAKAFAACLPEGTYTYTATADGYYASTCGFTVASDGTVSWRTSWSSTVLATYGLDTMLDGSSAEFYLDLEEFIVSTNSGAWDGVTLDVSWYTPGSGTYYISSPAQLAGLAAIVNGIYNAEITTIIDSSGTYTPEEYASYEGAKIQAGCSAANESSGSRGNNLVTSDDYYYSALGYDFDGETIYLTADLDMGGYQDENGNWTGARYMPIGGQYQMYYVKTGIADGYSHIGASFNGTFDGQGHIVYNIYCNRYSATAYGDSQSVGLIGRLGNHDSDYTTWQTSGDDGGNYPAESPTVRNVAVDGYIYARRSVGGIVGKTGKTAYNYFSTATQGAVIENCINFATVKNTDAKGCGGIVGAGWNGGIISNCANFGSISTTYACPTGGIVGSNENQIINCYNVGQISAATDSYAMAIGTNNGGGTNIQNCYWLTGCAPGGGYYNGGSSITVYEVTDNYDDTALSAAAYMASEYLKDDLNGTSGRVWVIAASSDAISGFLSAAGAEGCPVPRIFTEDTTTVSSIIAEGSPTKLGYVEGEYFDTSGLEVTAYWSDGTSEVLDVTTNIDRALEVGDTQITVYAKAGSLIWEETYDITVTAVSVESITVYTQPTRRAYNEGESFDPTGTKLRITYDNETTVTVQWQQETTFVNTSDDTDTYEIDIQVEDPLTTANSDGKAVTLSYTYGDAAVTCNTNTLTVISSAYKPSQDSSGNYLVGTADELNWVAAQVTNGLDADICILLTADITANSSFTPIGSSGTGTRFCGTLDGGGYTVTLALSGSNTYLGLIGYAEGATVSNVTVAGSVQGTGSYTAALIAYADDVTVSSCGSTADVAGGKYYGGLIAWADGVTSIQNCFNRGSVSSSASTTGCAGGLVGCIGSGSGVSILNSYNWGSVSGIGSGTSYGVGGIVGRVAASATIQNVYNAGVVTNKGSSSSAAKYVGSVVGNATSSSYTSGYSNYYWLKSTGCTYAVGGAALLTANSVTADNLTASLLGSAFIDNDGCLPILSYQTVEGHSEAEGTCIYCGAEL